MSKIFFLNSLENNDLIKASGIFSILIAFILTIIKIVACLFTGSISLMSSLLDSAMDLLTSLINFTAILYAISPPDEDHRFGHGKAEDLAALAQSLLIFASAIFIAFSAITSLIFYKPIENEKVGVLVMGISIALTLMLILFQRFVIKKTKSSIIEADSLHYITDILANTSVLVVLFITYFFPKLVIIDVILGLLISLYIVIAAWKIFYKAFNNLMDKEMSEDVRLAIKLLILSHPKIKGLHDLRTRAAGNKPIVQFHLELESTLDLFSAHSICDEVEDIILATYTNAEIIIHLDPENAKVHPILSEQVKKIFL